MPGYREENYSSALNRFFEDLIFRYRTAFEVKRRLDRFLASDFNLFEIFKPDEEHLSDVLALLLDPNGVHGQGTLFLKKFLEALRKVLDSKINLSQEGKSQKRKLSELLSEDVKIKREKSFSGETRTYRRMDLLLSFSPSNFRIAIENKPRAGDQPGQLADYWRALECLTQERDYILIYLSGSGEGPSEQSISNDERRDLESKGKLLVLGYREFLISWLKECLKECEADKVRWFLRDFVTYIENNFPEDKGMDIDFDKYNILKEYLFSKTDDVNTYKLRFMIASDIAKYFKKIKEEIKDKFLIKLANSLESIAKEFDLKINNTEEFMKGEYLGKVYLFKDNWKFNKEEVGLFNYQIEIWNKNWDNEDIYIALGIAKYDNKPPIEGSLEDLIKKFSLEEMIDEFDEFKRNYRYVMSQKDEWWIILNDQCKEDIANFYLNKGEILLECLLKKVKNLIENTQDPLDRLIRKVKANI